VIFDLREWTKRLHRLIEAFWSQCNSLEKLKKPSSRRFSSKVILELRATRGWRQLQELPVSVLSKPKIILDCKEPYESIAMVYRIIWRLLKAEMLQGSLRQLSAIHGGRLRSRMQCSFWANEQFVVECGTCKRIEAIIPKSQVKLTEVQGDVAHDIWVNSQIKFVVMCWYLFFALYGCYVCLISAETNQLKALKQFKKSKDIPLFQVLNSAIVNIS